MSLIKNVLNHFVLVQCNDRLIYVLFLINKNLQFVDKDRKYLKYNSLKGL